MSLIVKPRIPIVKFLNIFSEQRWEANPSLLSLEKQNKLTRKESEVVMKRTLLFFIAIFVFSLASPVQASKSVREWAFTRLNYARDEKTQQLRRYCDSIQKQAKIAGNDEVMLNFFNLSKKCYDCIFFRRTMVLATKTLKKSMNMAEIKKKAKDIGITTGKKKKAELVHSIQIAEGCTPCFGMSDGQCAQTDCCFMQDCLKLKP